MDAVRIDAKLPLLEIVAAAIVVGFFLFLALSSVFVSGSGVRIDLPELYKFLRAIG